MKNNQQFQFTATGYRAGEQKTTNLIVTQPANQLAAARIIATNQARQWANQNNLQNFHLN